MITINVLEVVLYSQLALSLALFFCLQIVILTRDKAEKVFDWIVYRVTWWAVGFQVATVAILGATVLQSFQTDPVILAHCILLSLINTLWFVSLRIVVEFVDYIYGRQSE